MPTTRNIKVATLPTSGSSTSIMPPASSSFSFFSSHLPLSAQPNSLALKPAAWEPATESPNDSESLPPRMRLKEKRRPFGEFRIIREPAPIQDHTTELKPIPSPPWSKDAFSLDPSHCLQDDTRGKGTSHARPSFPSNATTSPPLQYQERCTHSRNSSKSSAECSTTGGLRALSISSAYAWTASNRSPPLSSPSTLNSSFLSTSTSAGMPPVSSYPSPLQTDDASSDAGPSLGTAYQLRPHRTVKSLARSAQTASMHATEERANSVPDEDEEEITMATEALKQLQHSGMDTNTFPPPARPSRKQKRYACDVCGQIFTRSGDVRRHKESRHDNSEGCRCPFCDRVLTR